MSDPGSQVIVSASLKIEDWARIVAAITTVGDSPGFEDYKTLADVLHFQVTGSLNSGGDGQEI